DHCGDQSRDRAAQRADRNRAPKLRGDAATSSSAAKTRDVTGRVESERRNATMNEKPSEVFRAALAAVEATIGHFEIIEKGEHVQTLLDSYRDEIAKAEARLAAKKAELAQAEADHKSKQHIINFDAAKRLRELAQEIAQKRSELISLQQGE